MSSHEPLSPGTKEVQVRKYADFIGLDLDSFPELYWIAEQGLCAELPSGWQLVRNSDGSHHYELLATGQTRMDHPMDDHYRVLAQNEMQAIMRRRRESAERVAKASAAGVRSSASSPPLSPPPQATGAGGAAPGLSALRPRTRGFKTLRYCIYALAFLSLVHFLLSNFLLRLFQRLADGEASLRDDAGGGDQGRNNDGPLTADAGSVEEAVITAASVEASGDAAAAEESWFTW